MFYVQKYMRFENQYSICVISTYVYLPTFDFEALLTVNGCFRASRAVIRSLALLFSNEVIKCFDSFEFSRLQILYQEFHSIVYKLNFTDKIYMNPVKNSDFRVQFKTADDIVISVDQMVQRVVFSMPKTKIMNDTSRSLQKLLGFI